MKKWILGSLLILLGACASTFEQEDLSNTKLYMFPQRAFFTSDESFSFAPDERKKAKRYAKQKRLDVLFEVFLNADRTVESIKVVRKTRYADDPTIANIRSQIKRKGFFKSFNTNSAFYYGVTVRTTIEDI